MMYDETDGGSPPFYPGGKRKKQLSADQPGDPQEGQSFARPAQRPGIMEGENGRPARHAGEIGVDNPDEIRKRRMGGGVQDDGPDAEPDNDPDDNSLTALGGQAGTSIYKPDKPGAEPGTRTPPFHADNEPGGGKPAPDDGMRQAQISRAIGDSIRRRGPDINALVARRRAQTQDRFRRFGPTPTGGDENAPKPKIRPGRRAMNPYPGGGYS